MTAHTFRRTALGLGEAVEGAHMGHPDFRVGSRIFASLNADQTVGTIKLTPDEQQRFIERDATVFEPAAGAWGMQGWTKVHLAAAGTEAVGEALTLAWQGMRAKGPSRTTAKAARPASTTSATKSRGRSAAKPAAKAQRTAAKASERKTAGAAAARAIIDDYIAACAPRVQTILKKVRAMVKKEAPHAVEKFSYRMPAFEMEGMLLFYAPFKNHLGIFPPVTGDAALAVDLAPYRGEKGNLRFPFDEPMPYPLIRRVIHARLLEHAARLSKKRSTSASGRATAPRSKTRA